MKASWKALSERIDALSLRERIFLFLILVAMCVALVDLLWMSPARKAYAQGKGDLEQQEQEMQRLRLELRGKADQPDPALALRTRIAQVQAAIGEVDGQILASANSAPADVGLNKVLVQFLQRYPGLSLVRIEDVASAGGATQAPTAASSSPGAPVAGLSRRGLELTVSGPYAELARYVESLERALPNLRWGTMTLAAQQQPPQLVLQVFVVGLAQP